MERRGAGQALEERRVGIQQRADVLARFHRANEKKVAPAEPWIPARPGGRTGRADDDAFGSNVEAVDHFGRCRVGGHHNQVRLTGVPMDESRVVAPDLAAGALGMLEEIEIVDRDRLRRDTTRHEERMSGVGDLRRPGEAFDRGPSKPMPGEIEQPDGHPRIDRLDSADIRDIEAIFPGARERHDLILRPFIAARGQRAGEFVDVLADAGSLPERGAVIQDDAQTIAMLAQA
jgi:hypothetical protein